MYITEDISSRLLGNKSKTGIETISVEINLRKRKWFLNFSYNLKKKFILNHLERLNCKFSKNYDNLIFSVISILA